MPARKDKDISFDIVLVIAHIETQLGRPLTREEKDIGAMFFQEAIVRLAGLRDIYA